MIGSRDGELLLLLVDAKWNGVRIYGGISLSQVMIWLLVWIILLLFLWFLRRDQLANYSLDFSITSGTDCVSPDRPFILTVKHYLWKCSSEDQPRILIFQLVFSSSIFDLDFHTFMCSYGARLVTRSYASIFCRWYCF